MTDHVVRIPVSEDLDVDAALDAAAAVIFDRLGWGDFPDIDQEGDADAAS